MRLRPYQEEGIEALRRIIREGHRRALLVCPTGGGKTVVASEIIRSAVLRESRVLFLAHRKELIDQTSDKLRRFGVPHGIIQGARGMALQHPVQVASVQSLKNRLDKAGRFDLVMVDEAHHVTTENTYHKLLEAYPAAKVVGLTATPWRSDGKGLSDTFSSYHIVRTPVELRDEGFLVPTCGYQYMEARLEGVAVRGGDFQAAELEQAVRDKVLYGNIVGEWQAHAGNARTVVFCVGIAHSQELRQAFVDAGVTAEHLDGETPKVEREAILGRLRAGHTRVVCNVGVLTEGFDCPSIACVVLARPTLSTSLFLQMVGRGLRPVCLRCGEGANWTAQACPSCGSDNLKREARIHDHAGNLKRHGHPYSERDWSPTANIQQGRAMLTRRITDNWGNETVEGPPVVPIVVRQVEEAKKVAIGADGRSLSPQQRAEEQRRRSEWREKAWDERKVLWDRLVERHGWSKAKGVYRWVSGFSDFAPAGWVAEAQRRAVSEVAKLVVNG